MASKAKQSTREAAGPVVQTTVFQQVSADPDQRQYTYSSPVQMIIAEEFPAVCDLVVLSTVFGAARGQVGCTHELELEGETITRYEHPLSPVQFEGGGIGFYLELKQLTLPGPGVLMIKTRLSTGAKGQDIPFRISAKAERSALSLQG